MKALVTGASSGLGRDIARVLAARGCKLILTARSRDKLEALAKTLPGGAQVVCADLSDEKECRRLYEQLRAEKIDILVNNAGFGLCGMFDKTDLDAELRLIDTNIRAVHILTKLFLRDFIARDSGYILNVASSAAFFPGPQMAAYYASKAYVMRLTLGVREELRRRGSRVYLGAFCPGPVDTAFSRTADVRFAVGGMPSLEAARRAVDGMFARRALIIPGGLMKAAKLAAHFASEPFAARLCWHMQRRPK